MKVLVYTNKEKDKNDVNTEKLISSLKKYNIEYMLATNNLLPTEYDFDVVIVIGGDGTILRVAEFANSNKIPIIGINAGRLGFLTEFETDEIKDVVKLLVEKKLKPDERISIEATINGQKFLALNDVVLQRRYVNDENLVISADIFIDDDKVDTLRGDGVIACTPTGSTAYSLSAGGSFLSAGINAFSITPIAAHSLSQRPIVYSADSKCVFELKDGDKAGVFVDGKLVDEISINDRITVKKAKNNTLFLRKTDYNFFNRLYKKLKYTEVSDKND